MHKFCVYCGLVHLCLSEALRSIKTKVAWVWIPETRHVLFVTHLITEKVCSGVKIGSDVSLWSDNIQHFQVTLSFTVRDKRPSLLPKHFQRNVCTKISVCESQTYSQLRLCCCKPKQMLHRPPVNAANTARPHLHQSALWKQTALLRVKYYFYPCSVFPWTHHRPLSLSQ